MLYRLILFIAILTKIRAQETTNHDHTHSPLAELAKISKAGDDTDRPILPAKTSIIEPSPSKPKTLLDHILQTYRTSMDTGKPTSPTGINSRPKLPKPVSPVDDHSKVDSNTKPLGPQKLQKIISGKVTTDSSPPLVKNPIVPKLPNTTSTPRSKIKKLTPTIATDLNNPSKKSSSELPTKFKKPSIDTLYTKTPHASDPQPSSASRIGTSRFSNFRKPSIDNSNFKRRLPTDPAAPASSLTRSSANFKPYQGHDNRDIDNSRMRRGPADAASLLRAGKLPQTQIRPRVDSST